jgi:4-diphosphocytidyl-2-C-methyl-D-erythritol kinase
MSRESGSISLAAPAKINLSLRILGKRPDGFHELETLMVPIGLADQIEVSHGGGKGIEFLCSDPDLPGGADNLCVKAAEAFRAATGLDHGIRISLMKKVPCGAGLGGGSSDAAAVLMGLNELFDYPLVEEELHQIAATLGSDVPFFLNGGAVMCRGRGEILDLEEAPALPERTLLLIKPPFPVPTAWAYRHHAELKESRAMVTPQKPQRLGGIEIVNDLEPAVFHKYLLLPAMKEWLLEQSRVECAFMTGSGSTMVTVMEPGTSESDISMLKGAIASEFGPTMWMTMTGFKGSDLPSQMQSNGRAGTPSCLSD